MKRTPVRVGAMFLALAVAGCAQYEWQKYGATQADFNQDRYQCQMEAASAYPTAAVTQQIRAGYVGPSTTNCSNWGYSVTCSTTPGQVVAPLTTTVDVNQDNRGQAAKACMYARGYQLIRKN